MIDREKVLKGLKCCIVLNGELMEGACEDCPYIDNELTCLSLTPLLEDALELLKQPYRFGKWKEIPAGMTPGGTPMYACAECGGTEHLHGAEYPQRYVICEQCGSINTYPWETTIDEYLETGRKCR